MPIIVFIRTLSFGGVLFCIISFLFVGAGALDCPLINIYLFCNFAIIYMFLFQALMPRGTPTCLPCLKGGGPTRSVGGGILARRRQKRGKDRLFYGGESFLPHKAARFTPHFQRFARYVSYKFTVQNRKCVISLFSHRCETKGAKR